jgi:hypothetical protein
MRGVSSLQRQPRLSSPAAEILPELLSSHAAGERRWGSATSRQEKRSRAELFLERVEEGWTDDGAARDRFRVNFSRLERQESYLQESGRYDGALSLH